jgi:DNA replication protein DnaC
LPLNSRPNADRFLQFRADQVQLVGRCYQRGSIILTSNESYGDWRDIFADRILAAAIPDRLLPFSTTVTIRGQSYRLREKRRAGIPSKKKVKQRLK